MIINEDPEINARALEIAISLTKADSKWIKTDEVGNIYFDEPLFTTFNTVIRIIKTTVFIPEDITGIYKGSFNHTVSET